MPPDSSARPPLLIDTHAHLDEEAFDADRADVVARAQSAGIVRIVTIGTTADTSRRSVEIADQFPAVHAAVGIQPNYAAQAKAGLGSHRAPRHRAPCRGDWRDRTRPLLGLRPVRRSDRLFSAAHGPRAAAE